jgi:hypothetical protein
MAEPTLRYTKDGVMSTRIENGIKICTIIDDPTPKQIGDSIFGRLGCSNEDCKKDTRRSCDLKRNDDPNLICTDY